MKFPCEARRKDGDRCGRVLVNKSKRRVWSTTGRLIAVLCAYHYGHLERGDLVVIHADGARLIKDGAGIRVEGR